MTSTSVDQSNLKNQSHADNEIDLRQVVGSLGRCWPWIAGGSAFGLLLSGLHLLRSTPVYQGEFQIVLSEGNSYSGASALLSQNPALASLAGLGGAGPDSIATEVHILNSPSVLRPVFEAVKARKPASVASTMRFQDWAKSAVTVEEERGTSVLNVEYRDSDKELVLPITQMISQAYQNYSNRGRSRELSNVIEYLKEQIASIKPQSEESSGEAIDYGYSNGLSLLDGLPIAGSVAGAGVSMKGTTQGAQVSARGNSVEAARTAAHQKLKALEVQIQAAKKAGADSIYYASQLGTMSDITFSQLTTVDTRLADLRSRLKDNDPLVQRLERERKALVSYINERTIALLEGQIDLAKASIKALERPKDVVKRHRELTQRALRDEATLVTLQNQLKQFELEQARATSPWELISTPTLRDNPVAPVKKRIMALGLLGGLVIGSGAALVADRRTGLVFDLNELQSLLPGPLLQRLPTLDTRLWVDAASLLAAGPLSKTTSINNRIALVPVGDVPADQLASFASNLDSALGNCELLVSNDLRETSSCTTRLLITAPGVATRTQLNQLNQTLALQDTPLAGWILIDPSLKLS